MSKNMLGMNWYTVEENDAYKEITDRFFIVATKHKVLADIRYFIAKPVQRWNHWWWQDINDQSMQLAQEDDRYTIFTPLSF